MDKLQMTVTLSADSAPDLLAYLRQFRGARERAFMLKLLAQRGLQLVLSAGPDSLLRPPNAATAPINATRAAQAPDAPILGRPEPPGLDERGVPAPYASVAANSPSTPAAALPIAVERPEPVPAPAPVSVPEMASHDALAGLDLGALNDAMARFG